MRRPAGSGHWHVPTIRMVTLRLQLGRGQREAGLEGVDREHVLNDGSEVDVLRPQWELAHCQPGRIEHVTIEIDDLLDETLDRVDAAHHCRFDIRVPRQHVYL